MYLTGGFTAIGAGEAGAIRTSQDHSPSTEVMPLT
jgi:hypothetical protein